VIEHSFIIESGDTLRPSSLPTTIHQGASPGKSQDTGDNEASTIDFQGIRESVLDRDHSADEMKDYKFTFAQVTDDNHVKMDFQLAKDLFEKEFISQALKLNKGKINQTALKANIPKKTLLRKIEKYELNPKEYY
jgi:two-component system response regulator HydG